MHLRESAYHRLLNLQNSHKPSKFQQHFLLFGKVTVQFETEGNGQNEIF